MNDQAIKISVVVPFFNIKDCVSYCLQSLLNQDYEGCYEIVCVDDGSTDNTLAELRRVAAEDLRVRVFSKMNGGLSDARNYGVEHASGQFITFVDGDDVVSPYYLSSLERALNSGVKVLAAGTHRRVSMAEVNHLTWNKPNKIRVISKHDFIRQILLEHVLASAWCRLVPADLYRNYPYPVGRVYEDTYIAVDHILPFDSVAFIEEPIYGYVTRPGSIVREHSESMSRCSQYIEAIDRFSSLTSELYPQESDEQIVFRAFELSRLYRRLDLVDDESSDAKLEQGKIRVFLRANITRLIKTPEVCFGNKIRFLLLSFWPAVYLWAFNLFDRINGRIN